MELKYAHLCDYGFVADGKPSAIGIFSRINVKEFPADHGPSYLVFGIEFHGAEIARSARAEIVLRDADGAEMSKVGLEFQSQGTARPGVRPVLNQVIRVDRMQFPNEGDYEFAFLLNGSYAGGVVFSVTKITA